MNKKILYIFLVSLSFFVLAACSGNPKPDKDQIVTSFQERIPQHFTVKSLDINAEEFSDSKVDINYSSRFKSTLELTEPVYEKVSSTRDYTLIKLAADKGDKIEVFGRSYSEKRGDEWVNSTQLDKDVPEFGFNTKSQFGENAFIEGSDEHNDLIEKQKQKEKEQAAKQKELQAALKKADAQLTNDVMEALVVDYYNNKSTYTGKYEIVKVLNIKKQVRSSSEAVLNVDYTWQHLKIKSSADDSRRFSLSRASGKWVVTGMQ